MYDIIKTTVVPKVEFVQGIPEDLDINKSKTLGLKMAGLFVERMLGGKIDLSRAEGTEFVTRFKI